MQQRANIHPHNAIAAQIFYWRNVSQMNSSLRNIDTQVKRHFILGWKDEEEIVSNKSPKRPHGMHGLYDLCGC